jgi:hypothetical protein
MLEPTSLHRRTGRRILTDEMNPRRKRPILLALAAVALAAAGVRAAEGPVALGPPYRNLMEGFSLRPPADTEKVRRPSSTLVVRWSRRHEPTDAIAWTFSVLKVPQEEPVEEIEAFAEDLARKITREDGFEIQGRSTRTISGRAAVDIRGLTSRPIRRWQRQVWVQAGPRRFLVFVITGPPDGREDLTAVSDAVLETVEVVDPAQARQQRERYLKNGHDLLRELDRGRLAAAVDDEPAWFLMQLSGEVAGFMKIRARMSERGGLEGVLVESQALVQPPGEPARRIHRRLFTTPEPLLEEWIEQVRVGEGESLVRLDERGTVTNGTQVICDSSRDGRVITRRKEVPTGIYLPRAVAALLPRLVDLTEPKAYGFATYDSATNDFDYRQFEVHRPERIEHDGRRVEAVRLTDRLSDDALPVTLYVDAAGRLLEMTSRQAEGADFTLTRCRREKVLRIFPRAERTLGEIDE